MRLKDDHMKNGQLKAAYNVQLATEGRYPLAYDFFPNPTDTRALIPFLDRIEKDYFALPDFLVADAAYYGSEQNIEDITLNRLRTALITYNMYRKEKKKKYKNNPFNTANCDYDAEKDAFTCPNGQAVTYRYDSKRTDKYGYQRDNLRSMNVKIVQAALCESNVPRQRKVTTEKYFIMKNRKHKKR